jgi:LPXTG-motif cell wall-anchored protein
VKNEQSATSTMNVIYNKIGSHGEDLNQPSMIQSDNIWSDNILLEKNDDGTVKVTLLQPRLMDYMTSVSFAGVSMVKHVTSTNDAVKGSGSWTAILSKEQATKLKVGNKIAVQVSYTVPGAFTHNESALVVIKSITAGQPKDVTSIVKTASSGTTDQLAPVVAVTGKPSISSMSNTAASAAVDTTPLTDSKNQKFLPQTGNSGSLFLTILGIMVLAITAIIGMFNLRRKNEKEF